MRVEIHVCVFGGREPQVPFANCFHAMDSGLDPLLVKMSVCRWVMEQMFGQKATNMVEARVKARLMAELIDGKFDLPKEDGNSDKQHEREEEEWQEEITEITCNHCGFKGPVQAFKRRRMDDGEGAQ